MLRSSIPRYFLLICLLITASSGIAHEVRPAIGDIQFMSNGTVRISIEANLESLMANIGPQHQDTNDSPNASVYDRLRGLASQALTDEYQSFADVYAQGVQLFFDGKQVSLISNDVEIPAIGDTRISRTSTIHLLGDIPRQAKAVSFEYASQYGNIALKFRHNEEQAKSVHWLVDGETSPIYMLNSEVVPEPWMTVAWNYIVLGFEHIVPKGVDHILFVLGIFLLSTRIGPLLAQITAFTLAHSITLGLSIYGIISLSPMIVEPLIALSIVYVGVENIVRGKNSVSRLLLIFAFGLLHGLGFAGVLSSIGLPPADYLTALLTFNVGVELGQLAVISSALILVFLFRLRGHAKYRQWVIVPGSAAISMVGLYWLIERLGFI